MKLTRYPRSLAATLAAFPSVSLFPQLGSLITRIWIGQNASTASCTACPPWREVRPRESFRSWKCEASSHRLSINGLLPQKRREDARTRRAGSAHSKSPADCGTNHNGRKFAQARHGEFVLWRTAKTFIDSSTGTTNSASVIPSEVEESLDIIFRYCRLATRARLPQLGRFFFAALDLQHLPSRGQEHFAAFGRVACSFQTHAGMRVTRALPATTNCSCAAPPIYEMASRTSLPHLDSQTLLKPFRLQRRAAA